jgi:hypothetical protein
MVLHDAVHTVALELDNALRQEEPRQPQLNEIRCRFRRLEIRIADNPRRATGT